MSKKGPLSKAETFYIDNHHQTVDAVDIAADLDRTVKSVEAYIKKNHSKKKLANPAGDHFIRQKGVTIMSETSSTIADDRRKSFEKQQSSCITKITDKKEK